MMKLTACFLLMVWMGVAQAQDGAHLDEVLLRDQWDARHYQEVIATLESVIESGLHQADVYFNLGNGYWLEGNIGRALLNWRRAQVLSPRYQDIGERIAWGRLRVSSQERLTPNTLIAVAMNSESILTQDELLLLGGLLWSGLWGIFWVMRRWGVWRIGLMYALVSVSLAFVSVMGVWGSRVYVSMLMSPAIILEGNVSAYNGAGDDFLRLFTLNEGQEVYEMAHIGDWIRILTRDGREGWIMRDNVGFIPILG